MGKIRRANHETATRLDIYQIDQILNGLLRQIQENIKNKSNLELIIRYDNLMTSLSLSKATRNKNLSTVYHLTKFNNDKDWKNFTRTDAESVIAHIMRTYSDDGQETNTTFDFKKILKIFVRWVAFGSRDKRDVGDPDSTKWIKIKKVRDRLAKIGRAHV